MNTNAHSVDFTIRLQRLCLPQSRSHMRHGPLVVNLRALMKQSAGSYMNGWLYTRTESFNKNQFPEYTSEAHWRSNENHPADRREYQTPDRRRDPPRWPPRADHGQERCRQDLRP